MLVIVRPDWALPKVIRWNSNDDTMPCQVASQNLSWRWHDYGMWRPAHLQFEVDHHDECVSSNIHPVHGYSIELDDVRSIRWDPGFTQHEYIQVVHLYKIPHKWALCWTKRTFNIPNDSAQGHGFIPVPTNNSDNRIIGILLRFCRCFANQQHLLSLHGIMYKTMFTKYIHRHTMNYIKYLIDLWKYIPMISTCFEN